MKKILLSFLILTSIFSCTKDEIVTTPNSETTFARSNDGHDDDDEDDDDHDEDGGGQCCSFKYGEWSTCVAGFQVRSWTSPSRSCIPPTDSIQRTCESAIVSYFYYNPQYNSVRVASNQPGMIHIYNNSGQLTAILYYNSGTTWVSIVFLPTGTYTLKTYYRTITITI